jgi:hypothetical protein
MALPENTYDQMAYDFMMGSSRAHSARLTQQGHDYDHVRSIGRENAVERQNAQNYAFNEIARVGLKDFVLLDPVEARSVGLAAEGIPASSQQYLLANGITQVTGAVNASLAAVAAMTAQVQKIIVEMPPKSV